VTPSGDPIPIDIEPGTALDPAPVRLPYAKPLQIADLLDEKATARFRGEVAAWVTWIAAARIAMIESGRAK